MDFYEMTVNDIGNFCMSRQKHEKEMYKMLSIIQYRCTDKLIAGLNLKKPKNLKYEELFPEFEEKEKLTEEQKNILIAEKWREFLK